ncbi:TonB family C-terminal domain-containing protein [Mucilaginibacter gossypiicola]|uniref:TonB family C-terminal domain-containing protein n=1 Tax=Mucilaginibacter gossypiicola TaxID=551995 RepID=A0A1H8KMV7_9SPHI|nr:energy transducer TonB [Mucilaginibacter gossypiicola]SEN94147.1 TonB family C-terminal domain-containing protein [Mucilaginibacter gossypiicola]
MKKLLPILIILICSINANAQKLTPPHFRGGNNAFHEFLNKNLKWPESVSGGEGIVTISFFVESDGRLTDVKVVKGMSDPFNKEALRVIKLSERWIPAMRDGHFIKSKYTVPIQFFTMQAVQVLDSTKVN